MELAFVYVTNPDRETAHRIAGELLARKLIACANFLPIESMYPWEGTIERSEEIVAILKTRPENVAAVTAAIEELHPYRIPCIARLPVDANETFAAWVAGESSG